MDQSKVVEFIENHIESGLIPALMEYVKIPSLSTAFDPEWETNGYMLEAMNIIINYVESLQIQGLKYEILKEPGKPWLFFGSLEATDPSLGSVMIYGHLDKQPHMSTWSEGLGPTNPVIRNGRLYGRGASDDGYAIPSAALILKALQTFNQPHGKIFIIGENEEESDSTSLLYYIEKLRPRIGEPDLVVCLDSGIMSYDRLWLTTSLRGNIIVDVTVKTLKVALHSGSGSGIIASTFRVLQQLLGRLEDVETGRIHLKELHSKIETRHHAGNAHTMDLIGSDMLKMLPLEDGVSLITDDLTQLAINKSLTPTLVVTGIEGLPCIANAGNVMHPEITARLSFRIPPGVNATVGLNAIVQELTRDPPYGAQITVKPNSFDNGWEQKPISTEIDEALSHASMTYFGNRYLMEGVGGSIPFIEYLGNTFPNSQFIVTGLLGADSNAHSIDENLDIPYLKKLVCCLVDIFATLGSRRHH